MLSVDVSATDVAFLRLISVGH